MDASEALQLASLIQKVVAEFFSPEKLEEIENRIEEVLTERFKGYIRDEVRTLGELVRADLAAYIAESVIVQVRVQEPEPMVGRLMKMDEGKGT